MCTLILHLQAESGWPVVVAANRDEMAGRPWRPPGRHWADRPDIVAGLDELAGGSWMGVNSHGLFAAILNRMGTLGPAPGKRSRGELVLDALDHADAADAAAMLAELNASAWRPFNMVVADNRDAFWIRADGAAGVRVAAIPQGVHMLTAYDLDDMTSPRVAAYLPRFRAAPRPCPETGGWDAWAALMGDGCAQGGTEEDAAMCFARPNGFGTVSSSLVALPAVGSDRPWLWRFAAGRPDTCAYLPVP